METFLSYVVGFAIAGYLIWLFNRKSELSEVVSALECKGRPEVARELEQLYSMPAHKQGVRELIRAENPMFGHQTPEQRANIVIKAFDHY